MMQTRYDEQSPCTRCGSSMEDCDCCAEYELRSSMSALGIQPSFPMGSSGEYYAPYYYNRRQPDFATMDNDLATLNRMLREFGY